MTEVVMIEVDDWFCCSRGGETREEEVVLVVLLLVVPSNLLVVVKVTFPLDPSTPFMFKGTSVVVVVVVVAGVLGLGAVAAASLLSFAGGGGGGGGSIGPDDVFPLLVRPSFPSSSCSPSPFTEGGPLLIFQPLLLLPLACVIATAASWAKPSISANKLSKNPWRRCGCLISPSLLCFSFSNSP